ncbi:hypothetical protein PTSG_11147 [Salpingoeca rosetta]|uniref:Uncharacterized protein n=1 Tax=Salpingoeca rosetta (strain ATCC 50818 / BSB-021) TaxID=946362 RepID=F2USK1_SALR5|nr:uncharacterized protein PTSG_11147 [Salpingoeca rosetta]EGD81110.1 hypothetical protein PTSG_11147 [Salpingoeca rosetta]|eukprot:XP_004987795.1 hypothetical protein PTSG_11147 [Salpingoeca rosetta]
MNTGGMMIVKSRQLEIMRQRIRGHPSPAHKQVHVLVEQLQRSSCLATDSASIVQFQLRMATLQLLLSSRSVSTKSGQLACVAKTAAAAAAVAVRPHHRWALCLQLPLLFLLFLAGLSVARVHGSGCLKDALPLTHTSTPPHLHTSPRPFHNTKDRTLSPSVDTTLKQLDTTLKEHRVPFTTGQLRPRKHSFHHD